MQRRTDGFTLLELMIGLFIFSIGIMAVASMQIISRNQLSVVKKNLNDTAYASSFLERFIGLDYDDNMLADKNGGYKPDEPDHGPFTIENSHSTIEWEIDDDFPVEKTKRITITIRRIDPGGIKRAIRYEYAKCTAFNRDRKEMMP